MNTRVQTSALLLTLLLTRAPEGESQHPPVVLPDTEERRLRSSVNGVSYKLYVSLPKAYASSYERYPVVYLLDADYSLALAHNIVAHLSDRGHLPRVILIGIAYGGAPDYRLNRTRDYTPTAVPTGGYGPEYQQVSGGAPLFRRFMAEELIPFVEKEYRLGTRRVLVGHSYGGLFATWMALTDPEMFQGYIVVSPSLWYDDHLIFREEQRMGSSGRDIPARMYLTAGAREINTQHNMPADLRRFAARLEQGRYASLRLRWSVREDETHNSIFPGALSDGLRFVLQGR